MAGLISQYKGLRRETYILAFGRLVNGLGAMVWPMLTLILSQKMGVGPKQISWVIAASMVLMMPAVFAGGRIADRWDKKMTIVYLDLVSVVCYFLCAFIPMSWNTILLMFLASLCQNMLNPPYNALTADVTKTRDRERAYSLQYLCANLGLALAPTLAGILFNHYLSIVFLINGLSIGLSGLMILFMVKDTTPVVEDDLISVYQQDRSDVSIWRILRENRVLILYMAAISGYYATYQMYVYLMPLDLAAIHGNSGALIYGSVTSMNCLVVVIFTPVITRYFTRVSEPGKSVAGITLLLTGFGLFLAFLGHIPAYYFSMMILTWGEIFTMISESPYFSKRVPASHRGRINGICTVSRTAVTSLYQILIGAVYSAAGSFTAWMTVLAIGTGFVALACFMRVQDRRTYPNLYEQDRNLYTPDTKC